METKQQTESPVELTGAHWFPLPLLSLPPLPVEGYISGVRVSRSSVNPQLLNQAHQCPALPSNVFQRSSWTPIPQMRNVLLHRRPLDVQLLLVPELGPPVLDHGPHLHVGGIRDAAPLRDSRLHLLPLRLLDHPHLLDVPDGLLLLHGLQLEAPDLEEGQRINPSPDRSS